MKKWILIFLFLTLIPLTSGVTLDSGIVLNTSVSNSSMTFSSTSLSADQINIESTFIYIQNASWTNGDLEVNSETPINFSTPNDNVDISKFPYLSFSNNTIKNISSNLTHTINATVEFGVSSCNINQVNYTSHTGAYSESYLEGDWSCSSNRITLDVVGIERTDGSNQFIISYDTSGGSFKLPLDIEHFIVNTFLGGAKPFILIFFILIAVGAAYFSMPGWIVLSMFIVASAILMGTTIVGEISVFYALLVLAVAAVVYFGIAKLFDS